MHAIKHPGTGKLVGNGLTRRYLGDAHKVVGDVMVHHGQRVAGLEAEFSGDDLDQFAIVETRRCALRDDVAVVGGASGEGEPGTTNGHHDGEPDEGKAHVAPAPTGTRAVG